MSYNGATLEWTQGRQLSSIYGNLYSGGGICNYAYDSDGLRTSKYYNGTTYNYTWTNGQLTNQSWNDNNIHFYYDGDSVIGFNYNGASYTYIKNIQGDVVSIADSTGTIAAQYEYDAWGKLTNTISSIGAINPIRYRGYYYDDEIGMYYLQSRYYDPALRRFINEDAYTDTNAGVIGTNMFTYCINNPVSYIDTTGYSTVCALDDPDPMAVWYPAWLSYVNSLPPYMQKYHQYAPDGYVFNGWVIAKRFPPTNYTLAVGNIVYLSPQQTKEFVDQANNHPGLKQNNFDKAISILDFGANSADDFLKIGGILGITFLPVIGKVVGVSLAALSVVKKIRQDQINCLKTLIKYLKKLADQGKGIIIAEYNTYGASGTWYMPWDGSIQNGFYWGDYPFVKIPAEGTL